jgi:hypothetical protein
MFFLASSKPLPRTMTDNLSQTPLQPSSSSQTTGLPWSGNTLRQEAILDHAFQRDLILLQTLQSASGPAAGLTPRRSLKSENKQIDGEINGSAMS